jgi:hypothetical protein
LEAGNNADVVVLFERDLEADRGGEMTSEMLDTWRRNHSLGQNICFECTSG